MQILELMQRSYDSLPKLSLSLMLFVFALVSGCSQKNIALEQDTPEPKIQAADPQPEPNARQQPAPHSSQSPAPQLDAQSFFSLFLAEIADQRSEDWLSAQLSLQLAEKTLDLELATLALIRAERAGDQHTAQLAAQLLLSIDDQHPEALRLNTLFALQQGQLKQALDLLDRWLALDPYPDLISLYHQSGSLSDPKKTTLAQHLGDIDDKNTPFDAERDLTQALLLYDLNQPDLVTVKRLTQQSLARSPSSTAWQLLLSLQQGSELVDLTDDALAAFNDDRPLRLHALRLLYQQEFYLAALSVSQDWLLRHPDDHEFRLLAVQLAQQAQLWQQSLSLAEPLLQLNEHRDPAWYLKGKVHHELGQPQQAILAWQQVQPSSWFMSAQQRLALARLEQHGLEQALTQLALVRHRHPDYSLELWQLQIELTQQAQSPDNSKQSFNNALRHHPESSTLRYAFALWLWQNEQQQQALEQMEIGLSQHPGSSKWQNALGYSLAELNLELKRAHELISLALKDQPNNPAYQDSKAWVLYRLDQPQQAIIWIEQALQQLTNAETASHHIRILLALDRPTQARRYLNHYLDLFNEFELQTLDQHLRTLGY